MAHYCPWKHMGLWCYTVLIHALLLEAHKIGVFTVTLNTVMKQEYVTVLESHRFVVFTITITIELLTCSHYTILKHGMLLCSKHMGLGAELSLPAAAVSSGGHVKLCLFLFQSSS